jgi:hypothetical protein
VLAKKVDKFSGSGVGPLFARSMDGSPRGNVSDVLYNSVLPSHTYRFTRMYSLTRSGVRCPSATARKLLDALNESNIRSMIHITLIFRLNPVMIHEQAGMNFHR